MADQAAAPAPAKAQKKKVAKPKKAASHPKYSEMIKQAVGALKERGGSSRQAILKYIMANFNVGKDAKPVNSHLKLALRAGVKKGTLKQSKGTGASGSFRLGENKEAKKPKKPKTPKKAKSPKKAKKPKAKKPKSPKKASKPKGEKKAAKPKKPKTPKKAKAAKPKKAAKPAAKKSPKKAKAAKPKAKKAAKK